MNKKFLTKVVLATVLASGINLLPTPNFDAGKVQIAVAYAESKNFAAKEAAMTDVEIIEAQAKEASRMRAIEAVKEKIASYVRNFSGAKGKLNEDDIAAIAEKFEEVGEAKYKKLFYNAVDEEGKELGKVGIMYEATVTAKFNSKKITEYIKLTEQEKERRIRQAREAREHFKELDREYEELRKNARTKTPEQLQSDIKIFDDKISDLEKRRGKNKSESKKNKNTATKNKTLSNKPMKFSNPVEIGEFGWTDYGGFGVSIKKATYVNENPKIDSGVSVYSKGVARFGKGDNALYLHYDKGGFKNGDSTVGFKLGSENLTNAVPYDYYWTTISKVDANNDYKMYLLKKSSYGLFGVHYVLIGRRPDGKWVKYFNTDDLSKQYMGNSQNVSIQKVSMNGDTIIANYARNSNEFGEFRFKWDEAAKWFSVEKIDSQNKPAPQKTTQENKAVTNQPMQFSQPVEIGNFGFPIQAQLHGYVIKGASHIEGTSRSENYVSRETGEISKSYINGVAQFGDGKNAFFCKYDFNSKSGIQFGGKNNYVTTWNESYSDILKIDNNNGIALYVVYHRYCTSHLKIIGTQKNGKWVNYIDSKKISDMYFDGKDWYKLDGGIVYEKPKCKGDTIIIPYRRWYWKSTPELEGEIRLKWDEAAQWFSIEKITYQNNSTPQKSAENKPEPQKTDIQNAVKYFQKGKECNSYRRWSEAIKNFDRAIELNPNYANAYYERGFAYTHLKQYSASIADLNQAIKLGVTPHNCGAYNLRGENYAELKQYDVAISDYSQAMKINPKYATLYNNRGFAYYCLKQYELAIADFNKCIQLNPNIMTAYERRGKCYQALGETEKAQADFRKYNSND